MDPSERQGSQPKKKSRNPLRTSTRSTGALASGSARTGDVPHGGSGATPISVGGTSSQQDPSAFWGGMSLGGLLTADSNPSSSECGMSSCTILELLCAWSRCEHADGVELHVNLLCTWRLDNYVELFCT
ncbi:unnamed protein product [Urochloa humidicola]